MHTWQQPLARVRAPVVVHVQFHACLCYTSKMEPRRIAYIRNFIFGVEDSLVSTVGLLSGVAIAGTDIKTIILAGIVLIFVEAFSMGAGSLLSENSAAEVAVGREVPLARSYLSSFIMFISYFAAGFIPLSPYLFLPIAQAFWVSIAAALVALLILGIVSAKIARTVLWKQALQMLVIGGIAVGLGVAIGIFVSGL